MYSAADSKEVRPVAAHKEAVWRVCYSPDKRRPPLASMDTTVKVWDPSWELQTFRAIGLRPATASGWRGITDRLSKDNQLLASADGDGNVLVWNVGK